MLAPVVTQENKAKIVKRNRDITMGKGTKTKQQKLLYIKVPKFLKITRQFKSKELIKKIYHHYKIKNKRKLGKEKYF